MKQSDCSCAAWSSCSCCPALPSAGIVDVSSPASNKKRLARGELQYDRRKQESGSGFWLWFVVQCSTVHCSMFDSSLFNVRHNTQLLCLVCWSTDIVQCGLRWLVSTNRLINSYHLVKVSINARVKKDVHKWVWLFCWCCNFWPKFQWGVFNTVYVHTVCPARTMFLLGHSLP